MSTTPRRPFSKRLRIVVLIAAVLAVANVARIAYQTAYTPWRKHVDAERLRAERRNREDDAAYFIDSRRSELEKQTTKLPVVDRVDLFVLYFDIEAGDEGYPIWPAGKRVEIYSELSLAGDDAEELAGIWRQCEIAKDDGQFPHRPTFGIRFFKGEQQLFETSVDFSSRTCSVSDGKGRLGLVHLLHGERLNAAIVANTRKAKRLKPPPPGANGVRWPSGAR
jgi:hypothetical protein